MEFRNRRFLKVWHAGASPFAQNNIASKEAQSSGSSQWLDLQDKLVEYIYREEIEVSEKD
jgi:hypothetical protein